MTKKIMKHVGYYFSLFAIFTIGFLCAMFVAPNTVLQVFFIVLTVAFYVIWGILHHYVNHELTRKIAVEYLLIGLLGLSIIFFVFAGKISL